MKLLLQRCGMIRGLALVTCLLSAVSILEAQTFAPEVPLHLLANGDPGSYARGFEASAAGSEVSSLGDIDGDGICDFVTGDSALNTVRVYSGRANYDFIPNQWPAYRGCFPTLFSVTASPTIEIPPGGFGWDVANALDIDGDGINDVLVGAPLTGSGRAYLFSGASGAHLATFELDSSRTELSFGFDVKSLGDMDGLGRPELAISAPESPTDASLGGRVFVFSGETIMSTPLSGPSGYRLITTTSALGILAADSAYDNALNAFGTNIALLGDTNGDGRPDSLVIGAPGTSSTNNFGGVPDRSHTGAIFIFQYLDQSPSIDPTSRFILKSTTWPLTSPGPLPFPPIFEGSAECSLLGFDMSAVGDLNDDGVSEFVVGAMGRHPHENGSYDVCGLSHHEAGYARLHDGVTGEILSQTHGLHQVGDQERYAAYVSGDMDLDGDRSDCDFNGDGVPDLLISSYRKKFLASEADAGRGSIRLYSGAHLLDAFAVSSPLIRTSPLHNVLGIIDDSIYGRAPGAAFGEALALLPRESVADFPRIAAFEYDPFQAPAVGTGTAIKVFTPFGAIAIPTLPSTGPVYSAQPNLEWRPSSAGEATWTEGTLNLQLSSTAGLATTVVIVPSLSIANQPTGLTSSTYSPLVIDQQVLLTYFPNPPALYDGAQLALPIYRMDFDLSDWILVQNYAGLPIANASVSIPFNIQQAAIQARWPNHPWVHEHAATIYLQAVEIYATGALAPHTTVRTSNLVAIRTAPIP